MVSENGLRGVFAMTDAQVGLITNAIVGVEGWQSKAD